MNGNLTLRRAAVPLAGLLWAAAAPAFSEPRLTIYNGDFAVVRETLRLELRAGLNKVSRTDITRHLEPDSVMLRDPSGKLSVSILEQSFAGDPLSQDLLLSLYEGKSLDFEVPDGKTGSVKVVSGRVIRGPYAAHTSAMRRYRQDYYMRQMAASSGAGSQPIVEVDGRLQFGLPGKPLFPALPDDSMLKPTLEWTLESPKSGKFDLELGYITGGMTWKADYNVVSPENGDSVDLAGWVTMDNQSGRSFENAAVKLMAGDVQKLSPQMEEERKYAMAVSGSAGMRQAVEQKAFDEYHLYSLKRPLTLRDRETKQVEFLRASGVKTERLYVYDGVFIDPRRYSGWAMENIRVDREYGTKSNPKVWVMRQFKNTEPNGLGLPLPAGRLRFYRRDAAQLEFVGESLIDHTPEGESVRVYTGDAFDIVGERKRVSFNIDHSKWIDESFEIRLRNHKKEAVRVRVVEHLYRGANWELAQKSDQFEKKDSQTIEFAVDVAPKDEKVITYSVHYTW